MKNNKRLSFTRKAEPYLYLLPAMLLIAVFIYYPFGTTIVKSFFLTNRMSEIKQWVGLENYELLFKNKVFIKSIINTLKFTVITVPCSVGIAFVLACMASKKRALSPLYETLFSLPMAMSSSVCAMIFQIMFNPTLGIINRMLQLNIAWLNDSRTAIWVLIIIRVWMNIGYNFLFLLAAIRALPQELLECAEVEGAGAWYCARKIILPLVSPTVFFLMCSSLATTMTMSGLTLILTRDGGPGMSTETMISFMYKAAADSQNYNIAYPAAVVGFAITMLAVIITFIYEKKGVHYN